MPSTVPTYPAIRDVSRASQNKNPNNPRIPVPAISTYPSTPYMAYRILHHNNFPKIPVPTGWHQNLYETSDVIWQDSNLGNSEMIFIIAVKIFQIAGLLTQVITLINPIPQQSSNNE
jgi:hypothetical protein